jgi:hypothetical protein
MLDRRGPPETTNPNSASARPRYPGDSQPADSRRLHDTSAEAADTAIAAKSVLAYRSGSTQGLSSKSRRQTPRPPARGAINSTPHRPGADRRVPRVGSHAAPEAGMPVQTYVGFGDRDLDLTGERGLPY